MINRTLHPELLRDEEQWRATRLKNVNSSECAALFGQSSYLSYYQLWNIKNEHLPDDYEENEAKFWGKRLEESIAMGWAERNGKKIRRIYDYISIPESRLGSSFDYEIDDGGLLEIKNVDSFGFLESWECEGSTIKEAPPRIEFQLQHQLLVSGKDYVICAALVGGDKLYTFERRPDEKVWSAIIEASKKFWSLEECPSPIYPGDIDVVATLYNESDPEKEIAATEDVVALALEYDKAREDEKAAKAVKGEKKCEILRIIGDAERVYHEDFSIKAKQGKKTRKMTLTMKGEK